MKSPKPSFEVIVEARAEARRMFAALRKDHEGADFEKMRLALVRSLYKSAPRTKGKAMKERVELIAYELDKIDARDII